MQALCSERTPLSQQWVLWLLAVYFSTSLATTATAQVNLRGGYAKNGIDLRPRYPSKSGRTFHKHWGTTGDVSSYIQKPGALNIPSLATPSLAIPSLSTPSSKARTFEVPTFEAPSPGFGGDASANRYKSDLSYAPLLDHNAGIGLSTGNWKLKNRSARDARPTPNRPSITTRRPRGYRSIGMAPRAESNDPLQAVANRFRRPGVVVDVNKYRNSLLQTQTSGTGLILDYRGRYSLRELYETDR